MIEVVGRTVMVRIMIDHINDVKTAYKTDIAFDVAHLAELETIPEHDPQVIIMTEYATYMKTVGYYRRNPSDWKFMRTQIEIKKIVSVSKPDQYRYVINELSMDDLRSMIEGVEA